VKFRGSYEVRFPSSSSDHPTLVRPQIKPLGVGFLDQFPPFHAGIHALSEPFPAGRHGWGVVLFEPDEQRSR